MKKPFRETKIGKLATNPIVSGILKSIPGVGDVIGNVIDETKTSPAGQANWRTMMPQLIKLVITATLTYLWLSGKISFDDAEQAKNFIGK